MTPLSEIACLYRPARDRLDGRLDGEPVRPTELANDRASCRALLRERDAIRLYDTVDFRPRDIAGVERVTLTAQTAEWLLLPAGSDILATRVCIAVRAAAWVEAKLQAMARGYA